MKPKLRYNLNTGEWLPILTYEQQVMAAFLNMHAQFQLANLNPTNILDIRTQQILNRGRTSGLLGDWWHYW